MSALAAPERFATIDALRGVAAICVMLYHAGPASPVPMPGGYLAVDLFFALSGFVIAHSYANRIDTGLGFATFMRLRIARLWPMLIVGALLGMVLHGGHAGMLFLLPDPRSTNSLFPTNPPYWSLLLEMLAYAAFAILWKRVGWQVLGTIVAVSAAVLAFQSLGPIAIDGFGAFWKTLLAGVGRLGFAFGFGVALWCWRRKSIVSRSPTAKAWIPIIAFVAISAFTPRTNLAGLLVILLAVPVLASLATCWELKTPRIGAVLGDISYPLYCIHVPIIAVAADTEWALATLAGLPVAALLLDRVVDRRARIWLKQQLVRTKPAAASYESAAV